MYKAVSRLGMAWRVAGSSHGARFSSEPAPALTAWSRSVGMEWPSNRKGRHAKTSGPGKLALPRHGSMRQAFRATYGQRADGWPTGWPQSGAHRMYTQGRLNEDLGSRRRCGPGDAANGSRGS